MVHCRSRCHWKAGTIAGFKWREPGTTLWRADTGDTNAWVQVDLERIVNVSRTRLAFPRAGGWRYKIEISGDGKTNWKLFVDQAHTADSNSDRTDVFQEGSGSGGFVHVSVLGNPAGQVATLAGLKVSRTQVAQ